jgi:4-hydroxy-tetrahydrodipicolinate synthase
MREIDGVVPVIPIPFADDESIDEKSLSRLVDFVAQTGMAAMCLPAYGSEFYKLSEAERERVITIAIDVNAGRIPLIAQANHGSSRIAAELARKYEKLGADIISFALPRQFTVSDQDLIHYSSQILDAIDIPGLIQDFNPGGVTIDADFIARLHERCPNFRYAKLEEPLIVDKLVRINERIGNKVGVLEGWGGYYMLEAIPHGICGIMPGVPICDLLDKVYRFRRNRDDARAFDLMGRLLPYINFSLQNIELYMQVEKRLLKRRGLIAHDRCRSLCLTPSHSISEYIDTLLDHIERVLESEGASRVGVLH